MRLDCHVDGFASIVFLKRAGFRPDFKVTFRLLDLTIDCAWQTFKSLWFFFESVRVVAGVRFVQPCQRFFVCHPCIRHDNLIVLHLHFAFHSGWTSFVGPSPFTLFLLLNFVRHFHIIPFTRARVCVCVGIDFLDLFVFISDTFVSSCRQIKRQSSHRLHFLVLFLSLTFSQLIALDYVQSVSIQHA